MDTYVVINFVNRDWGIFLAPDEHRRLGQRLADSIAGRGEGTMVLHYKGRPEGQALQKSIVLGMIVGIDPPPPGSPE